MKRYRLSRLAKDDLDRIWNYVGVQAGMETADRLIDSITGRFPILAGEPEAGVSRHEVEPGLRSFPVGSDVIYYRRADSGGIQISRVIHGKRDQRLAYRSPG
jgi:toxin ParE1/3/4